MRLIGTTLVTVAIALTGATGAQAQSAKSGYDETDVVQTLPSTSSGTAPANSTSPSTSSSSPSNSTPSTTTPATTTPSTQQESASGSSLPFTGLDAGLIALAGLVLVGTGVALRRGSRSV